jgi:hypothetical protein
VTNTRLHRASRRQRRRGARCQRALLNRRRRVRVLCGVVLSVEIECVCARVCVCVTNPARTGGSFVKAAALPEGWVELRVRDVCVFSMFVCIVICVTTSLFVHAQTDDGKTYYQNNVKRITQVRACVATALHRVRSCMHALVGASRRRAACVSADGACLRHHGRRRECACVWCTALCCACLWCADVLRRWRRSP